MPSDVIRPRLSKDAVEKLFGFKRISVSKGISEVLDNYSEKVGRVLKEFLKEGR